MRKLWLKIYKWEFWAFWFFYIPVYFYWIYLSIRARNFFFFSAANPSMEMGGFSTYSKYNILKNIPSQYIPQTILLEAQENKQSLLEFLAKHNLQFPLIAKPDIGERGKKVSKIKNVEELWDYISIYQEKIILQEFIDYPLEFGIMYYRFPNQETGKISSLVQRDFLKVVGNGSSTVSELLKKDKRNFIFLEHIQKNYPEISKQIPVQGEVKLLEPIGNHSRGTIFRNANNLINEELTELFDKISTQIPGFYFGRYDLKVPSLEDLYAGKNIKIVELNGANSEPAHIYDPHNAIWRAYRDLFKHWRILYRISRKNHDLGVPYMPSLTGFKRVIGYMNQKKGNLAG